MKPHKAIAIILFLDLVLPVYGLIASALYLIKELIWPSLEY